MNNDHLIREIDAALTAHAQWKHKLSNAINIGQCEQGADAIACDDRCAFGQWLYGQTLDAGTKARKPYQVTRRLHADFHVSAGKIAKLAEQGEKAQAWALMDSEYSYRSDKLNRALQKWRGELSR
ncbi:MAG: CZB domain-containing protein [Pseudomonadota bacterium]|nr:CZB domain-containing protein [Pseudomonadota bacterium]